MNKTILVCLISLSFFCLKAQHKSPTRLLSDSLSKLKKEGKLTGDEWFYNPNATKGLQVTKPTPSKKGSHDRNNNNNSVMSTPCNCWIPRDTSFHPVPLDASGGAGGPGVAPLYQNDDWSTAGITLPFKFCFYGDSTVGSASNKLFINNNGIVTFGAPFSVFSQSLSLV